MRKIKLIDLLNMIVNKENLPETIEFHGMLFTLYDNPLNPIDYEGGQTDWLFNSSWWLTNHLEDEVTIIEENKKIEKLQLQVYNLH